METIIGMLIGALITGIAMILNSYFSTKFSEEREDRKQKRERMRREIEDTQKFYENVLHSFDKLIRNKGRGSESELEESFKQEIRLKLISNKKISNKFQELDSSIVEFAKKLPEIPKEFIPKFEDDDHRRERLETREKAKKRRDKEAKKYLPEIRGKYDELSILMKEHLSKLKLYN